MEEPRNLPCHGWVGLKRAGSPWHAPVWVPGWLHREVEAGQGRIRIKGRNGGAVM